jgi:coenzyme F420-reducing hydrogenase delta subunit
MMKNNTDKITRFEQAITLSKEISTENERVQIQEMLKILAEKFIKDLETLRKLKELISMGIINEMIVNDTKKDVVLNALKKGLPLDTIADITGLDESVILEIQAESNAA